MGPERRTTRSEHHTDALSHPQVGILSGLVCLSIASYCESGHNFSHLMKLKILSPMPCSSRCLCFKDECSSSSSCDRLVPVLPENAVLFEVLIQTLERV